MERDDPTAGLSGEVRKVVGEWAGDLAVAVLAAREGGRAVLQWYGEADLDIQDPTGRGPVTMADRASHRVIEQVLTAWRPGDRRRSEEAADQGGAGGATGRLWIVDPLDGTREFIDRIPEFSVMVGLVVEGEVRLGAVCQPVQDRLYAGAVESGAWRLEGSEVTRLDARGPSPRRLRLVRSRSHPDERLQALESALGDTDVILSGSVGTKCAMLAEGTADLYVHPVPYLREWDTCAPEAILRAAGGEVTDCSGRPLTYGKTDPAQAGGIFASRSDARRRVADIVLAVGGIDTGSTT